MVVGDADAALDRLPIAADLHAPAVAREWARTRLAGVDPTVCDDVLLVVSELVTNAVRHARPEVSMGLDVDPGRIRVEVRDGHPALPQPTGAAEPDGVGGRGLLIVAAVSTDWGVTTHGPEAGAIGKSVWAEIALPTG